jgi:hypothetical protein
VSKEQEPGARWAPVVAAMLAELRSHSARAEAYWAQQLAFGPVLVHAISLAVRSGEVPTASVPDLARVVRLAGEALGALPDGCSHDPTALQLLARRQAVVVAWGRRRHLARLGARLGLEPTPLGPVPQRLVRPYPLIGWRPPEQP